MQTDIHLEELLDEALECLDAGRNEDARDFAIRATEHAPNDPEGWEYLGTALWRLGRIQEAADAFQHWRDLAPLSRAAHRSLAGAMFRLEQYDRVEEVCQAMAKHWPKDPYCLVLLANVKYKQGAEYRSLLDTAFALDPQTTGELLTRLFDFRRPDWRADTPLTAEAAAQVAGLSPQELQELAQQMLVPHQRTEGEQPVFYEREITAWRDALSWYGLFPPRLRRRSTSRGA
ncbi:MAG: tetratricopeptide repeat protein [Armatimonadota bacterium]